MTYITKLLTLIALLHHHALIHTIEPNQPMTQEQAIAVLYEAGWDESMYDEALAIMNCESSMIPSAEGDYHWGNPYAIGLFQTHFWYNGFTHEQFQAGEFGGYGAYYYYKYGLVFDPYDPVQNATLARLVYERSDSWQMWSCRKVLE